MANKLRLEFEGMDEVIARLKKLDANVKDIADKALVETHKIVTAKAHEAIRPHKKSGVTEASIIDTAQPFWSGTFGVVHVGFDLDNGGLPSIFLMYGTPRIKKDQKLYNAFYGSSVRNEIMKAQEDIFYDELRRLE